MVDSRVSDERYPEVPSPVTVLVRSVVARPLPGKFVSREPSPINLFAVIEDAMIRCDDRRDAYIDPVLIFKDEMVAKLLKYPI